MASITVTLPEDVQQALDEITRREGIGAEELVGRAVQEHLFLRRFRLLRQRMVSKSSEPEGLSDEDVFDRVS